MRLDEDLALAERAARAAAAVALEHSGEAVEATAKDAPTDVVTEVDRAAEAAAIELIARERPQDGFLGEEGAQRPGARTWVVDALDGTLNYLLGLRGWCAAVALEDAQGAPLVSAVCDPVAGELFSAARGRGARLNGAPLAPDRSAESLDEAAIATFLHAPKRDLRGVVPTFTRLLASAGSLRMTGSGTLELAYVAAGRLHGWIQPATYRWDWVPGALLVTEAGGIATRSATDPEWCIAAISPALHAALEALTTQ
jgi:myo-inositol-1(or 4)-monophosphatase